MAQQFPYCRGGPSLAALGFAVLHALVAARAHADTRLAARPLAELADRLPGLLPRLLAYLW